MLAWLCTWPVRPQRALDRVQDVLARHTLVPRLWPHGADKLRGNDEALALSLQPAANDSLRAAAVSLLPPNG